MSYANLIRADKQIFNNGNDTAILKVLEVEQIKPVLFPINTKVGVVADLEMFGNAVIDFETDIQLRKQGATKISTDASGNVVISDNLIVLGEIDVSGGGGDLSLNNLDISDNLNVGGDVVVEGDLEVVGDISNSTINGLSSDINDLSNNKYDKTGGVINGSVDINGGDLTFDNNSKEVRIGVLAGKTNAGVASVAIGFAAGSENAGFNAVAVGALAGNTQQGSNAVAIGQGAGSDSQGSGAVAIGPNSGGDSQGADAIAIGESAGNDNQGINAIAIGASSAPSNQGQGAIAIGTSAGEDGTMGNKSIAIGTFAGSDGSLGEDAIAIGTDAGLGGSGVNCVLIGTNSGCGETISGTIVINATGAGLNSDGNNRLFIAPIRDEALGIGVGVLKYNPTTKEITYSTT